MKNKLSLLSLLLVSSAALADTHQYQLDLDTYTADKHNDEEVKLKGSYYFDKVDNNNVPWAEAAFMGRNSNVSALYLDSKDAHEEINISGEYFGQESNDLYAKMGVSYLEGDFGYYETIFTGELGYFVQQNWLISVESKSNTHGDSYPVELKTKYIGKIDEEASFNIEASIDDSDKELVLVGDYHWIPQASVGVVLSTDDDFDIGVKGEYFFTSNISMRAAVDFASIDDYYYLGLTARF